ncbi:methyl-accepting chemotaxis protein [Marinihelvus fidelis]|uniref:Methyl-accepting chemotaxis protein n=1 Tax=Marinihelvus fidelis TaxID=2613842 RepID=A0A5N0T7T9_9GAMM|nr:methyl-accepting chemotaxis protein [Marinihelvus fidelis]KAA9130962.1 methyl-accepting chemotaxis protein [Marinihelvus fidelis]
MKTLGQAQVAASARSRGFGSPKLVIALAVLTVLAGIAVGVSTTLLMKNAGHERTWTRLATEVQVGSQKLSKAAAEAALGNIDAIGELESTYEKLDRNMQALRIGSPAGSLPPTPEEVGTEMRALNSTWTRVSDNAYEIINAETTVNELALAGASVYSAIPQIQADTDRMVRELVESGAPNQQVFAGSRQLVLADRMQRRVSQILRNGADAAGAAEELRAEMGVFAQVQRALQSGNQRMGITPVRNQQALASLSRVRQAFDVMEPQLEAILGASERLRSVRLAADHIFLDSEAVYRQAGDLSQAVAALPRTRAWPSAQLNTAALVALIVLAIALVGAVLLNATRKADTATQSNRRTQEAIIRLLDELGALAEGDLTTRATVTDEITGAIADAVNFAIERLRELVIGINQTASEVAESAESTRTTTSRLAESANEQAGQVGRATEKIQDMSSAFNTMAKRSLESSETALNSVTIAHTGAGKVRKTISGMDTIRDQIQETSKRIKRLGESTQEIGDIVSLIKDIAEQTNVLALNAAIQAASAGGSGQGFGVVADEVQQLAESATNATRRITGLVQTIQADTAEAVRSMEETTSEVVNGARLAQDAGAALSQIELASTELSALIEDIAREAEAHSGQAQRISELMDGIRDVSVKTSKGTTLTADAVSDLADRVMQLQASVSDFKLPETASEKPAATATPALAPPPDAKASAEPDPDVLEYDPPPKPAAADKPAVDKAATNKPNVDKAAFLDNAEHAAADEPPPSLVPQKPEKATSPDAAPVVEAPDWDVVEYDSDSDNDGAEDKADESRRESA